MNLIEKIKAAPRLRKIALWLIVPRSHPRPRLGVRLFLNRFYHKRGKRSHIRFRARLDVFPYHLFNVGSNTIIEDYAVINNGAGDVSIGDNSIIGIGTVIIGPVKMGNGAYTGQHVFMAGFNHGFMDGSKNSRNQPVEIKGQGVILEEDVFIGSNSVVLAGVTIGKGTQIGAGSVVSHDLPPHCIAAGNPAKVIKQYNFEHKQWERVDHN
ncbi:MAG: acyltransferase [Bacteroidota bacterium]|nr:acyltransferase [Bacteroidota bacterium]